MNPPSTMRAMRGALRVSAYFGALLVIFGCWSLRDAVAQAELTMSRLGSSLRSDLGHDLVGPPSALSINGQLLMIASRTPEMSVHDALDRFEAHCQGQGSAEAMDAPLALLEGQVRSREAPAAREQLKRLSQLVDVTSSLGVLRSEHEAEGQLTCFARDAKRSGLKALVEDLSGVAETSDLSRLGKLRYVTARKLDDRKTHVLVVWSEGPLRLSALFPETGDGEGSDMRDIPRPPATRRELCAQAVGHSYGLRLYRSTTSAEQVLAFYDRELPKMGWTRAPVLPDGGNFLNGVAMRAFVRAERAIAIGIEAEHEGHTGISLVDLGTLPRSTAVRAVALGGP